MKMPAAILTYHSLDNSGSVVSVRPDLFREQIERLMERSVPIVPLDQAPDTPGSVALTFDDGFENLVEHAFPLLEKHALPATVFAVSGYIGRLNTWPGQPPSIPRLPLMNASALRETPGSVEIGAHTVTHPDLTKLPPERAAEELKNSRAALEDITGRPVRWLAYPYGASTHAVRDLARREFALACGVAMKFVGPDTDRADLPRIDAFYLNRGLPAERLLTPSGTAYIAFRNLLRTTRARLTAN